MRFPRPRRDTNAAHLPQLLGSPTVVPSLLAVAPSGITSMSLMLLLVIDFLPC